MKFPLAAIRRDYQICRLETRVPWYRGRTSFIVNVRWGTYWRGQRIQEARLGWTHKPTFTSKSELVPIMNWAESPDSCQLANVVYRVGPAKRTCEACRDTPPG